MDALERVEQLRRAYDGLDGLALLRGVLEEAPCTSRPSIRSPSGAIARSATCRAHARSGYMPCTRPVSAHEPPRAGRWWGLDRSECGIHVMDKAC